ncbi:MAG TPA: hypothetical protein PKO06_20515 [Candidatus Ozemobacteraceae bacterium]|nr:hypothetical protein [Candidatus Ozemobacteraceae bacterium]
MKRLVSLLVVAALVLPLFPLTAQDAPAAPAAANLGFGIDEATFKTVDAMIEKALTAYNAQDPKAFYADFAKMMAAICTDQAFETLYKTTYMTTYGKYKSRTYKADASTLAEGTGLFTYEAEFEKGKALIQVNITKEENALKIMQLAFSPAQ